MELTLNLCGRVWCPYDEHDVNLAMLPMFHQYGCLIVFSSIATGSKIISVPKFNFTEMLQIVQDYQVSEIVSTLRVSGL